MSNEDITGILDWRFSIFDLRRQAPALGMTVALAALLVLAGCNRAATKEEKGLRAELRKAIDEQAYERAVELARRHLKLRPRDNGTWDRLVRAQFALQDLAAVSRSLDDWRNAVPKAPLKLDEYAGDYAAAKQDDAWAVAAWKRAADADPKNVRIWEKIARLEKRHHFWTKEDAAWTAVLELRENAVARVNRALCRRQLHRWHEAFEDLEKAQAVGPDDPEVLRGAKLFARLEKSLNAIRELDSALALSPNDSGLLADRALLFLRADDPEPALEDAEAAGKIGTWAVRPKLFQALALIALGRARECEQLGVHQFVRPDTLTFEFLETVGRLDSEI